jgi:hypothetical protein
MSKDDELAAKTRRQVDNAVSWLEKRYFTDEVCSPAKRKQKEKLRESQIRHNRQARPKRSCACLTQLH